MKILLSDLGKRYNREWIFRHLHYEFIAGNRYALTGPNGSGKSTLLQLLAGSLLHNEGQIEYQLNNAIVVPEKVYPLISFSAPYLQVPEEFTLNELLKFHFTFKRCLNNTTCDEIMAAAGLTNAAHKQIRFYSSGMKQRVRLAVAFFSDTPILLLDEPCSYLDVSGIELYNNLLEKTGKDRLIVISSNDPQEIKTCSQLLSMESFKK